MNRKLTFIITAILLSAAILLASCNADGFIGSESGTSSGTVNTGIYSGTLATALDSENLYPDTFDAADFSDWQSYDFGTEYVFDLDNMTWTSASDPASDGVAAVTLKTKSIKIENTHDGALNIRFTGSSSAFKITVNGTYEECAYPVRITLDGVSLTSDDRALNFKDTAVSYLVLEGENLLETNINSADKNVLKSDSTLIIDGDGSLAVTANSKNGITSDGYIAILGGDVTVTVASSTSYLDEDDDDEDGVTDEYIDGKGTCIKPMLGFYMADGTLSLYGENSSKGYESKGIKVDGFEEGIDESLAAGNGWIVIDGGCITVETQGKAISSGWKASEDDCPADSANNPVPDVYINGGEITITTYATPRDDTASVEGVSPEGIEAKNNLYITGGTLVLNTTDDCLNASNAIYISGGLIYARATANDAVDAGAEEDEGYICISGGVLLAMGAGQPETGIDCNSNSRFQYTGGIVIAMGGGQNNTPAASGTSAYTAAASNLKAGTTYALVQDGEVMLALTVPSTYSYGGSALLGSGELETGSAVLISGATVSASSSLNGAVYYGTVSVSGGTQTSLTVSSSSEKSGMGGLGIQPWQRF